MLSITLGLAILFGLALLPAHAGGCVYWYNGGVPGNADAYDCMKFDQAEKRNAAKFGLRLGTSFTAVKRQLVSRGWSIDRDWLENEGNDDPKRDLVCGTGHNAICSTAFKKNGEIVRLDFSDNNAGTPLIGVNK